MQLDAKPLGGQAPNESERIVHETATDLFQGQVHWIATRGQFGEIEHFHHVAIFISRQENDSLLADGWIGRSDCFMDAFLLTRNPDVEHAILSGDNRTGIVDRSLNSRPELFEGTRSIPGGNPSEQLPACSSNAKSSGRGEREERRRPSHRRNLRVISRVTRPLVFDRISA